EERAGDLACCVRALFDVDGQREEVEVILRVLRGAGSRKQHGLFIQVRSYCALCLLREAACFEANGARAVTTVVEDGFGELDFRTLHGISFVRVSARRGY